MKTRREIIKLLLAASAALSAFAGRIGAGLQWAWAETKRLLVEKGTPLESLTGKDPAQLDASRLEVTPLEQFGTMGQTDHRVSLDKWRLSVGGAVARPLALTYEELVQRPAVERKVLLICPGFFAYQGLWKGISVAELLAEAGMRPQASRVEFSGPKGRGGRIEGFDLDEARSGRLLLAYQVNGQPLPRQHGFPLRLVAEDHYGARWVKYLDTIEVL